MKVYTVETILKDWKRFKRHFCIALGMVIIDCLLNYSVGKNISGFLFKTFSLLILYAVLCLCYKKGLTEKKDYSWLIRWGGIFWLDAIITMSLCLHIPAIIFAVYRRQAPYVYIFDPTYECIINMITFIIVLVYCVHLKMNLKVNNTLLYMLFFIMYSGSVLFHFAPEKLQLIVLQSYYSTGNPDFLQAGVNYYKPAIKEAVLAFIILDTSNMLPMLKDRLKNR